MRPARALTAAVTVSFLLAGCSTNGPTEEAAPPAGTDAARTATPAEGAGGSDASAPNSPAELQREPQPVREPLPQAATDELWLPLTFTEATVVDPGWTSQLPPQYADGVFLGVSQRQGFVEYAAIDVDGTVLWTAQRPADATDFSLRSDEQGTTVAVLPDTAPDGSSTVSGYDLRTGEPVWGPTQPPGPGKQGDSAQSTGSPAGDGTAGRDGAGSPDGAVHTDPATGTSVILQGTTLHAEDAQGAELWSLSVEEGTTVTGVAGGLLYLRQGDAIRVHNVMTGAVARAYDPEGQGRVVVPRRMVTDGAALLLDGERLLLATAAEAPPVPTP